MPMKALITPDVLRWARETARMSTESIAAKMRVKEERIKAWEMGKDAPTMRQLEKLSTYYRRPIAVFFLPTPPSDFETLRDFRKKNQNDAYSTALTFHIRDIQAKQAWLSELLRKEGDQPLEFIGKFNINTHPKTIAKDIKHTLDIAPRLSKGTDARKYWIEKAEQKQIFVSLAASLHSHLKIDVEEVKGFAITDKYAPFIFVNSADSKNAQLFTLVHELAHLWIDASGVSAFDLIDFRNKEAIKKYDPVEILCNRTAAEALMPEALIKTAWTNQKSTLQFIKEIAQEFHVSTLAMLIRALNLKLITDTLFQKYRNQLALEYQNYLKSTKHKKAGGGNYYRSVIRRNSKAFTSHAYAYYKSGKINGIELFNLLGIKTSKFNKLEEYLYGNT